MQHSRETTPLVSCIMPTRNRRRFVGQAIWYFLRQDYAARELIVVDDGEDAVEDLVPDDARIRYLRLKQRTNLGSKRNVACEISRGELIVHWDDDDWMAPNRLTHQVEALLRHDADVCAGGDVLHYQLFEGRLWRYSPPGSDLTRLAGGTLVYRRAVWARSPFPNVNSGEDVAFLGQLATERIHVIPDAAFYVALIHRGNIVRRNLNERWWSRQSLTELGVRLGLDHHFYATLRHGAAPVPKAANRSRSVTLGATFVVYDGYGSMAEYLALGMERAGAVVNPVPFRIDRTGLRPEFTAQLDRSKPEPGAPVLCFAWWGEDLSHFARASDLFINTMWETSRLPGDWPARLDRARAVIVPSRRVAEVFRVSGVTAPIEVVPQGIDPDIYFYEERPLDRGLTTLMVGVFVPRKNVHEGIAAWKLAFADDPDARLIIKSRFQLSHYEPDDPRIEFVDSNEATRGIAHWYRRADVLMALGNEGFGLPLVEGMATGLPVIALDADGQADVCAETGDLVLSVPPRRWVPFNTPPYGDCGERGIPDVADIATRLRWVAEHREAARAMGRAASAWAHTHRNVWAMGPAMLDVMERHLRPQRRMRWLTTLWAPRRPDGLATAAWDYATRLAALLPSTRLVTDLPDLRGVRVLHVLPDDAADSLDVTRYIQQARYSGIPVAVTFHRVADEVRAWERDADLLIAQTAEGVAVLHARWPDKRVELMPVVGTGIDGGGEPWTWMGVAQRHLELWRALEAA